MAFLVCFNAVGKKCDFSDKAIYLNQAFYKMLYHNREILEESSLLRKIALLGYDDVFELTSNTLLSLKMELEEINRNSNMCHPQTIGLLQIIEVALSGGKNIVISGDMYLELNRKI